jgi:hypothetical protein
VIACYVLLIPRSTDKLRLAGAILAGTTLLLAIVGAAGYYSWVLYFGRLMWSLRVSEQTTICTIRSQSEAMRRYIYDHELLHEKEATLINAVAALEKLKYNVFADSELCASSQLPSPGLPISAVGTRAEVSCRVIFPDSPRAIVQIRGWAVDWPIGALAGGVTVVLDGVEHPARYGLPSDGAVKMLGSDAFSHAGFTYSFPLSELRPGPRHTIFLKVLTRDRTAIYLAPPNPATFETKDLYR